MLRPMPEKFDNTRDMSRHWKVAVDEEEVRDRTPLPAPKEPYFITKCEEVVIIEYHWVQVKRKLAISKIVVVHCGRYEPEAAIVR